MFLAAKVARDAPWVVVVVGVTAACYFTAPLQGPVPSPGTTVTVTITSDAADELTPVIGAAARTIDGRLLSGTTDTLVLAVSHVGRFDQTGESWRGEHLALPRSFVTRIERRRFSVPRTTLLILGLGSAIVLADKILSTDVCNANLPYGPPCR